MKYFVSAILMIMIIGFPLASWYYLDSGLSYRIDLREALEPKGNVITDLSDLTIQGKTTWITRLEDKSNTSLRKYVPMVYDQFKDAPSFQSIVLRDTTATIDQTPFGLKENNFMVVDVDDRYNEIIAKDWHSALIDTSGNLRYVYGTTKEDYDTLVEHIAIVLPRLQSKDIAQKKYGTQ